jgi:GMP synthase-like glutamine amidotransferase
MPTCLVVQHVAPESAFAVEDSLVRAGVLVDTRHIFAGDELPADLSGLHGLVVMGGPMSAASDQGFPSRRAELDLLSEAIASGLPTLGVCLGAQLLAAACGATVYPGEFGPEIGWSPVTLSDDGQEDRLFGGLPRDLTVLQWHGDTFDLPVGAEHLCSSPLYPNQAFRVGESGWGIQFHLEVTAAAVDGFLSAFALDAMSAPGGPESIRDDTAAAMETLEETRDQVLDRFAALVATRASGSELVGEGYSAT